MATIQQPCRFAADSVPGTKRGQGGDRAGTLLYDEMKFIHSYYVLPPLPGLHRPRCAPWRIPSGLAGNERGRAFPWNHSPGGKMSAVHTFNGQRCDHVGRSPSLRPSARVGQHRAGGHALDRWRYLAAPRPCGPQCDTSTACVSRAASCRWPRLRPLALPGSAATTWAAVRHLDHVHELGSIVPVATPAIAGTAWQRLDPVGRSATPRPRA